MPPVPEPAWSGPTSGSHLVHGSSDRRPTTTRDSSPTDHFPGELGRHQLRDLRGVQGSPLAPGIIPADEGNRAPSASVQGPPTGRPGPGRYRHHVGGGGELPGSRVVERLTPSPPWPESRPLGGDLALEQAARPHRSGRVRGDPRNPCARHRHRQHGGRGSCGTRPAPSSPPTTSRRPSTTRPTVTFSATGSGNGPVSSPTAAHVAGVGRLVRPPGTAHPRSVSTPSRPAPLTAWYEETTSSRSPNSACSARLRSWTASCSWGWRRSRVAASAPRAS